MIFAQCTELSLFAQEKDAALNTRVTAASIPFIGCKSDGQVGDLDAPEGTDMSVSLSEETARGLAYYKAKMGMGVLAPRGWYCFGTYGSGGAQLFVGPERIEGANLFAADRKGFGGPVIEISYSYGNTSGRDEVAQVIARVFPEYKAFVAGVVEMFDRPSNYFRWVFT
jgi:hypothetical protein